MATILYRKQGEQFFDANGDPLAGGKFRFDRAGTTTLLTTYSDAAGTTPNTQVSNRIILDAAGRLEEPIYIDDSFDAKETLYTSADVIVDPWPFDNIPKAVDLTASLSDFSKPRIEWATPDTAATVNLTTANMGGGRLSDTSSNSITYNLPSASAVGNGRGILIKKTSGSNTVTVDGDGSETIDGSTTFSWTGSNVAYWFISDGANWQVSPSYLTDNALAVLLPELGGANGLVITNNAATPTTSLDIDATDAILVDTSGNHIRTGAVNLTIAAAGTGANGLDTGSLANSTWYYAYIISNGTTVSGLLSTSATSPTMPSGYTYKYRVGAIRTGGSATFVRIRQVGNRAQYEVVTSSTTPNLPSMVSGASGDVAAPTWTAVATGAFVPPSARGILGVLSTVSGSARVMAAPNNDYGAYDSTSNPPPVMFGKNGGDIIHHSIPFHFVLESTNIYYASSNSNGKIACRGWVDAVNAN